MGFATAVRRAQSPTSGKGRECGHEGAVGRDWPRRRERPRILRCERAWWTFLEALNKEPPPLPLLASNDEDALPVREPLDPKVVVDGAWRQRSRLPGPRWQHRQLAGRCGEVG